MRFCMVGGINTGIDYGLFNALVYLAGWPALMANTLSVAAASINSYIMNRYWTFGDRAAVPHREQLPRFFALIGTSYLIGSVILYALHFFLPAWAAKIFVTGFMLAWNYTGSHLLVFRVNRGGDRA